MILFQTMINHLIFWCSIFIGGLGISVIITSVFLTVKYSENLLKRYTVFLCMLEVLFLTEIIELYSGITGLPFYTHDSMLNIISYILLVFILSLYYPYFIVRFAGTGFRKITILMILLPALFFPAGFLLYFTSNIINFLSNIADILFFLIICGWTIFLLKTKPYLSNKKMTVRIRILLLLILLFVPFFIIDIIIPNQKAGLYFDFISIPFLVFYLVWNVLNLGFAFKIFFLSSDRSPLYERINPFSSSFQLSTRETEIVSLIIKGESNKGIAFTLKISERTVKNHIYNIFKKSKVQSRTELFVKLYDHA